VLGEAERRGILEVRGDAVSFRHELARQAVVHTCTTTRRMLLNQQVLGVLLAQDEPDLARVVHHAIEAGDDAAVVAHAPDAARRAVVAGAQGQAAAWYEQALRRHELLAPEDRAGMAEAYAWALFHSDRRRDALRAAQVAVRLREDLVTMPRWARPWPACRCSSGPGCRPGPRSRRRNGLPSCSSAPVTVSAASLRSCTWR
jgi:hypothetical protein